MTSATRRSGGMSRSLENSQVPIPGRLITGKRSRSIRSRASGRAGEIRVSVRISPGRVAATFTQTAPPRELPIRCTGPRFCFSISAMTVCARAAIE